MGKKKNYKEPAQLGTSQYLPPLSVSAFLGGFAGVGNAEVFGVETLLAWLFVLTIPSSPQSGVFRGCLLYTSDAADDWLVV